MTSLAEENYLKAIYKIFEKNSSAVSTSSLADSLKINAASVTDFVKKMADKKLVTYQKSRGVALTGQGKKIALKTIRKHRLWEVWLVNTLNFKWDEVHDIAEQLEHIQSNELIERLDNHLGNPKVDPHGDLIPNAKGKFIKNKSKPLLSCVPKQKVKFIAVAEHSTNFLQFLTKNNLKIGDTLIVERIEEYDKSFHLKVNKKDKKIFSKEVVNNILVVDI
jgi:DtxR family Mn-dependent transcriptional regulator